MSSGIIEEKLFNTRFELFGAVLRRTEVEEILDEAWDYYMACWDAFEDAQMDIDNARNTMRTLRTEQKNTGSGENNEQ